MTTVPNTSFNLFKFLTLANHEVDTLYTYVNAIGTLTHVLTPPKRTQPLIRFTKEPTIDDRVDGQLRTNAAERVVKNRAKKKREQKVEVTLEEYNDALEELRSAHRELLEYVNGMLRDKGNEIDHPKLTSLVRDHVTLSDKVIHICSSSSTIGPGPFFANGIVKSMGGTGEGDDEDWGEARTVALRALKASISNIRRTMEPIFSE